MPNRHYWSSSNQNEMYVHLLPNVNHTQIKESVSLSHSHPLLGIVMRTVKYIYFHLIHALSTSMCSVQFSSVRFGSVQFVVSCSYRCYCCCSSSYYCCFMLFLILLSVSLLHARQLQSRRAIVYLSSKS